MIEENKGIVIIELKNGKYSIHDTIHHFKLKEFDTLKEATNFIYECSMKIVNHEYN